MVARESRAELEVHRDVRVLKDNFLATARLVSDVVFGERHVGVATLRSPIVADATITGTSQPRAKIYDSENLSLKLLWRVSTGNKHDGSKFFRAKQAFENGVYDKSKTSRKVEGSLPLLVPTLRDLMASETLMYETTPDSTFRVQCDGITTHENDLVHPGNVIFGLTLVPSDATDALLIEQKVAEDTLARVSGSTHAKTNPQPDLFIPFMRVSDTASMQSREDFINSVVIPNLFPLIIEVQPVEIGLRT